MVNNVYRYISLNLWGNLPSALQRSISSFYSSIYNKSFTRYIIKPYCKFNYPDPLYLDQFRSASGSESYTSFQDFFTRVYKVMPEFTSDYIWPCEGLLCDYGPIGDMGEINVKGDVRNVRTIFGSMGTEIPDSHFFSNVFLHNNNYHRIHSPVKAKIKAIEHLKGDLVLLRPWVYKNSPSLPALRNERINLQLEDTNGGFWYLSIVGGPAVGTIVMENKIEVNLEVNRGQELAKFLLGSTCCMASPLRCQNNQAGDNIFMGKVY